MVWKAVPTAPRATSAPHGTKAPGGGGGMVFMGPLPSHPSQLVHSHRSVTWTPLFCAVLNAHFFLHSVSYSRNTSNIIQLTFKGFFHSSSNDNVSLQLSRCIFWNFKDYLLQKSTGMPAFLHKTSTNGETKLYHQKKRGRERGRKAGSYM